MEKHYNQRKFRLDDVKTEVTGNPNLIREYYIKNNNQYSSDRTFLWLLCGCDKYCSCDSQASWTDPTCPSDGNCRCDDHDPRCGHCINV